jgi:hypothetical protein
MQPEVIKILRDHRIPFDAGGDGSQVLLQRGQADPDLLRSLGFRISGYIGRQMVVSFKGRRIGLLT